MSLAQCLLPEDLFDLRFGNGAIHVYEARGAR